MKREIELLKNILDRISNFKDNKSYEISKEIIKRYENIENFFKNENYLHENIPKNTKEIFSIFKTIFDKMIYINLLDNKGRIRNLEEMLKYLRYSYSDNQREVLKILYFDKKATLIKDEDIFYGTIDKINIFEREIVRKILIYNAKSIIIVHNHLSGDSNPSKDDIKFTKKINKILKYLDISLYDHIIITKCNYYSFKEKGLI